MNKLIVRAGAVAALATAATLFVAPLASAADCTIDSNGALSHNSCHVTIKRTIHVSQTNNAHVTNKVTVVSNTGGNKANFNTGGDVSVTSGDSSVTVDITNTVNGNTISP